MYRDMLLGDGTAGRVDAKRRIPFDIAGDPVRIAVRLNIAFEVPSAGAGGVHHAALAAFDDQVDQFRIAPLMPEFLRKAAGLQAAGRQMEDGLQNGKRLVHHHGFILVDDRRFDTRIIGAAEHVLGRPNRLPHGVAGGDSHGLGSLGTVEVRAAELRGDRHAGKMRLLRDQVGRRVLECLGNDDQALGKHIVAEGAHNGQVAVEVVAAHVHLDAAQFPGQAAVRRQALGQQAHRDGHAVRAADVVDMLMCVKLREYLIFAADLNRFVAVDNLGAEIMDAAAAKMHMDDGPDVRAVKAGDQGV